MIKTIESKPETKRLMSSFIPNEKAALNPIRAHRNGIIMITMGILVVDKSNIPKVKIVVGHGKPNVGEEG